MGDEQSYYPRNGVRICIDRDEPDIQGLAYSPLRSEQIEFKSFNDIILKMEYIFDEEGYPQAFQTKRTFCGRRKANRSFHGMPEQKRKAGEILAQQGELYTLDIMIGSRKNASWQGSIGRWDERNMKQFDGDMELLHQILNFLCEK